MVISGFSINMHYTSPISSTIFISLLFAQFAVNIYSWCKQALRHWCTLIDMHNEHCGVAQSVLVHSHPIIREKRIRSLQALKIMQNFIKTQNNTVIKSISISSQLCCLNNWILLKGEMEVKKSWQIEFEQISLL